MLRLRWCAARRTGRTGGGAHLGSARVGEAHAASKVETLEGARERARDEQESGVTDRLRKPCGAGGRGPRARACSRTPSRRRAHYRVRELASQARRGGENGQKIECAVLVLHVFGIGPSSRAQAGDLTWPLAL